VSDLVGEEKHGSALRYWKHLCMEMLTHRAWDARMQVQRRLAISVAF